MIVKSSRLPPEEFKGRGYRTVNTPFFSLKAKSNGLDRNRFGVVVGKKVDSRAVQRNFWERQVKSRLAHTPNLGKDVMVIIFPKVKELTKAQFGKIFEKSLRELL